MSPAISDRDGPVGDGDDGRDDVPQPPVAPASYPPHAPASYPPVAPSAPPSRRRRSLAVGAGAVLLLILTGLPLGVIWSLAAPGVPVIQAKDGAIFAQPQPEGFIAADGWFSLLGLGLGVLAAIAVWLVLRRYRGPIGIALVVLGMAGAAVLAWQLGRQIGLAGYQRLLDTAPAGATFEKPPDLHAISVLLLPAFGAAVVYTLLAGWSRYPGLRPEPEPGPGPPFSWDWAAPPTPTAAPAPPEPGAAEPPRD